MSFCRSWLGTLDNFALRISNLTLIWIPSSRVVFLVLSILDRVLSPFAHQMSLKVLKLVFWTQIWVSLFQIKLSLEFLLENQVEMISKLTWLPKSVKFAPRWTEQLLPATIRNPSEKSKISSPHPTDSYSGHFSQVFSKTAHQAISLLASLSQLLFTLK